MNMSLQRATITITKKRVSKKDVGDRLAGGVGRLASIFEVDEDSPARIVQGS